MNENRRTRIWPIVISVLVTAVLTFWGTFLLMVGLNQQGRLIGALSGKQTEEGAQSKYLSKLSEIRRNIDQYFIGEVDEEKLADEAASGMIKGLGDEWSFYISAKDYDSYLEGMNNAYVGIGVVISAEDVEKGLKIVEVTPDSPAYQAGLENGDLILKVDGVPVLDGSDNAIDLNETKNRVRGKEGTKVRLTVSHADEIRDISITRSTIKTVNVTHEFLDNGVLYVRIRNFEKDAAEDVLAVLEEGRKRQVKGILFDVRYNPGGFKDELVKILDYLLPEGPLFRSVDYAGKEVVDQSDASCLNLPMAVLVNYDSYSAAEFFAAALQEYKAAVIVGEQTYGKGRFQTTIRISDGSAVNLSVGQYTTPNGVSLVGKGIAPDYPVDLSLEDKEKFYYGKLEHQNDAQFLKGIEVLTNE